MRSEQKRYAISEVGLTLPASLTFEGWRQLGRRLGTLARAGPWLVGDWTNAGRRAYGHGYREALEVTGLSYGTLRNYASVAARFELRRRRRGLEFGHHEAVAALGEEEQDGWLEQAEREGWSVKQLRSRLRQSRARSNPRPEVEVRLRLDPERRERWQASAAAAGVELVAWLTAVADQAAAELDEAPALVAVA